MDTVMKHFSVEERKLDEIQEIAEREGRKDYDVMREALASFLKSRKTENRVHSSVPGESIIRPNDKVLNLDFQEMWIDNNRSFDNIEHGDIVRAIQDNGKYFTYYKFLYIDDSFICKQVAPIKYSLLEQFNKRTNKYRV